MCKGGLFHNFIPKVKIISLLHDLFPLEILHPLEYYLPQLGPDVHPQREGLLETYGFECLLYREVQLGPSNWIFH